MILVRSRFLCYFVLGLHVSARFQQELHSCGVAFARGPNERSAAILLVHKERKKSHKE